MTQETQKASTHGSIQSKAFTTSTKKKTLRLNSGQTETGLSLTCLEIVQNNNNLYLCLVFILDKRITSIKPVYSRCVNSEIVSIGFLITA